jgi:hypothetical protein
LVHGSAFGEVLAVLFAGSALVGEPEADGRSGTLGQRSFSGVELVAVEVDGAADVASADGSGQGEVGRNGDAGIAVVAAGRLASEGADSAGTGSVVAGEALSPVPVAVDGTGELAHAGGLAGVDSLFRAEAAVESSCPKSTCRRSIVLGGFHATSSGCGASGLFSTTYTPYSTANSSSTIAAVLIVSTFRPP